jgi:hypothetical protein
MLHMQAYAPSTPGGYYTGTSGTSSTSSLSSQQSTTTGIYINGVPYIYSGPFTLVCYNVGSTTSIYRYDSCYDPYSCASLLNDYRNCMGTVKRFMN